VEERNSAEYTTYLFNGKELDEETGLYYYGARYYDPRVSIWASVDPMAEKYDSWSPYNYALNSPVLLIDPMGESVTFNGEAVGANNAEEQAFNKYKTDLTNIKSTAQSIINTYKSKGFWGKVGMLGKYATAKTNLSESSAALNELSVMERDAQVFNISFQSFSDPNKQGGTGFNMSTNSVEIGISKTAKNISATIGHEMKHGYQFLAGEIDFAVSVRGTSLIAQPGQLYGSEDEVAAFKRNDMITGSSTDAEDVKAAYSGAIKGGGSLSQMNAKQYSRYKRTGGIKVYNKNYAVY
jgi:RHS repeat-associated protein